MHRAVLDTCALVPGRQRDFLVQVAADEAYAPLWGSGVLLKFDYVLAVSMPNAAVRAATSADDITSSR